MSLREKFAWVAFVTLLLGLCAFAATLMLGYRYVIGSRQVLWTTLVLIVITIVFPLSMRALLTMRMPTGAMKEQDERERFFELKATRMAFFVLAVGALIGTPFVMHAPGSRLDVVSFILALTALAHLVKFGAEIVYHRRSV